MSTVGRPDRPLPPLLRWVGGKQRLASRLASLVPPDLRDAPFHEPFLGAGSLYFHLLPPTAHLSDANGHLIDCYRFVRDKPQIVNRCLQAHARKDSEEHYYAVRDIYNRSHPSAAQAARFLYLNRTCFNGIFRVNQRGAFNVPYGHLVSPRFPSREALQDAGTALARATLSAAPFEASLAAAAPGDLVYLDPPYPPLNGTAFFTHYTPDRFDSAAQTALARAVHAIHSQGVHFMMSNADLPHIRDLYSAFTLRTLNSTRSVSSTSHKLRVRDLIISNF